MDYSSLILKKTKASMIYMNGYRVLRYELKGFSYLILAIFLVTVWESFFQDNLFDKDVWYYIAIATLLIPFLYCFIRPVSLMAVIKYLDKHLDLKQRLETFIENLGKKDDVINLQRKDTYRLLSVLNPRSVVKFKWPLETRILPFVVFLLCLLFAGKGLFDSEKRFVTGTSQVKEEGINYQIVKNPFKNSLDPFNKENDSHIRRNISNTRKIFKTSAGNSAGLAKLKIPENDQIQSKLNTKEYKSMALPNQQRGEGAEKQSKSNKARGKTSPHKDTKLLTNPDDKTDNSIPGKKETGGRPTKSKLKGSTFTEADVSGSENILDEGVAGEASSRVNDGASTTRGNGSAGAGSYSAKEDVVEIFSPTQLTFVGDLSHIDEMISKNNIQPSLREYVKKYFLSLHVKSGVGE